MFSTLFASHTEAELGLLISSESLRNAWRKSRGNINLKISPKEICGFMKRIDEVRRGANQSMFLSSLEIIAELSFALYSSYHLEHSSNFSSVKKCN